MSVTRRVADLDRSAAPRSMPARTQPTWRKSPWPRVVRVGERRRGPRRCGSSTSSGTDVDRATRRCRPGPSVATQSSRSRVANAARKSARISSCDVVVVLVLDPLLAAERAAQVGEELRLDRADREPLAVAAGVDVVTGVAAGEEVVARARAPRRSRGTRRCCSDMSASTPSATDTSR